MRSQGLIRHRLLIVLTMLLVAGCQTPMPSGSSCVLPPGSLNAATTFSWRESQSPNGLNVVDDTGYVSPLMAQSLRAGINKHLLGKGFREVAQGADVEVTVELRIRRELVAVETGSNPCHVTECWERIDTSAGTRMDLRTVDL